ncbi:E3 ubiquitin-protein ligase HACE1 [Clarias magur]|uniref:E3 ubiquitin-protein ligase HACE1 n=1 Tax=Clarias magur TaxID=1594786 RepID=A0A8J4TG28_CLAMG|nr:E3 ubiquitin-protein ligase HACE1 [Clarias magur]
MTARCLPLIVGNWAEIYHAMAWHGTDARIAPSKRHLLSMPSANRRAPGGDMKRASISFLLFSEVQPLQPFGPGAYASLAAGRKE